MGTWTRVENMGLMGLLDDGQGHWMRYSYRQHLEEVSGGVTECVVTKIDQQSEMVQKSAPRIACGISATTNTQRNVRRNTISRVSEHISKVGISEPLIAFSNTFPAPADCSLCVGGTMLTCAPVSTEP